MACTLLKRDKKNKKKKDGYRLNENPSFECVEFLFECVEFSRLWLRLIIYSNVNKLSTKHQLL